MSSNKVTFLLIGIVLLFSVAIAVLLFNKPSDLLNIPVKNTLPGTTFTVNAAEFIALGKQTGFISPDNLVINNDTVKEYKPKNIILSFEALPEKNPGYFNVFKNSDKYLHGYKVTETNGDYIINYYLNTDFYTPSSQSEVDKLSENLITQSILYLGQIHKNKAKITTEQLNTLFSVFKNYEGKYNLINVKKI